MPILKLSELFSQSWNGLFGKKGGLSKLKVQNRRLVVENLEERQLLSITPIDDSLVSGYVSQAATSDFTDVTSESLAKAIATSDRATLGATPSNTSDGDALTGDVGVSYSLSGMTVTLEEDMPVDESVELPPQEFNGLFLSLDDELDMDSDTVQFPIATTADRPYGPMTYAEYLATLQESLRENDGMMRTNCGCGGGCDCGTGCDCNDGCGPPRVDSFWLSGCNTSEVVYACSNGGGSASRELFTFQECNTATILASASMNTGCQSNAKSAIVVSGGDAASYWSGGFTWTKPANKTNAQCTRAFTFTAMVYTDANNNNKYDQGESVLASLSLYVYIGYAEIKTVDFTEDHGVLKTNWVNDGGEWKKDLPNPNYDPNKPVGPNNPLRISTDTYTYEGTAITGPEWDVNRKTNAGQYVSFGASYTKGTKVSTVATFEVDSHGRAYQISGYGGQYLNFPSASTWTTIQGTVSRTHTATTALPSSVAIVDSNISWSVSTVKSGTNAGTSGNHRFYVTYADPTPYQTYATDGGIVTDPPGTDPSSRDNASTEKRLGWACSVMNGTNTPEGAALAIRNWVGHGYVQGMQTNWDAWAFHQGNVLGDCGTEAALAVAGLGQIGIAAQHELAFATSDTNASTMEYANFDLFRNGNFIGTFRARLIFTDNNYEGFFTINPSTGGTWGYTCFPKGGPFKSANLHLEVIRAVIGTELSQFWVWNSDITDSFGNIIYRNGESVAGAGSVPLP